MAYLNSTKNALTGIVIAFILFTGLTAWAQQGVQEETDPVSGEPVFYYTIQKGDTLWDLSKKFYNSQWDWPGLWEMNKDIKNPHWIYPGKKIRVFLKPGTKFNIPKTPEPRQVNAPEPIPDPIAPTFSFPAINRVGFIKKKAVESLGNIIRERDGNLMMSTDDIIYLKPARPGAFTAGKIYQIFNVEPVKEKFNGKRFSGVKHVIKAEVEILEITDKYAVGRIGTAYRAVSTEDMIMEFYRRDHEFAIDLAPDPLDATLVCSEDNTVMINDYRIAFIDKGSKDHVRPGQIYTIYQSQENQSVYDGSGSSDLAPLRSGRLIVLHTEEISATVVVLSSSRDIHPGDMVN